MGPGHLESRVPLVLILLLGVGLLINSRSGEAQTPPAQPAASPAQDSAPRLIGVVIAQDGRGRAYLQDSRTGRVRGYEVGETVGDARVVAIEPDRVVLDRDGSRLDIRFSRTPGGEAAPTPAAETAGPGAPPSDESEASTDTPAASQAPVPAPGQGGQPADVPPCPPSCPVPPAPPVPSGPAPQPVR
jgi:type II secretory pathway component PulC